MAVEVDKICMHVAKIVAKICVGSIRHQIIIPSIRTGAGSAILEGHLHEESLFEPEIRND